MSELVFVDTNVLIYARDSKEATKRERARSWLTRLASAEAARINLQVLNELTRWILANELRRDVDEVRAELNGLRDWGANPLSDEEVELAWEVRRAHGFNWFDCLLIAAAHGLGCRHFLTEDMRPGAHFGHVVLVNPFQTEPDSVIGYH
jgi:predicted nucleic acid-binding protein